MIYTVQDYTKPIRYELHWSKALHKLEIHRYKSPIWRINENSFNKGTGYLFCNDTFCISINNSTTKSYNKDTNAITKHPKTLSATSIIHSLTQDTLIIPHCLELC